MIFLLSQGIRFGPVEFPQCPVQLAMNRQRCGPVLLRKWHFYLVFQVRDITCRSVCSELHLVVSFYNGLDEIKHLIGSETSRNGVLRVFELFQNPILNRRLVYVLFEGILDVLFPEHNISEFFQKIHGAVSK